MLEVLYSTMLLNRDGWQSADAAFSKISNKKSPIALDLRYKILQKQLIDHCTTLATRKRIEKELDDLAASRKRDVLDVNQYYEGRMDNNVDML